MIDEIIVFVGGTVISTIVLAIIATSLKMYIDILVIKRDLDGIARHAGTERSKGKSGKPEPS